MKTLLEQLYVSKMTCSTCEDEDLILSDNKVLRCKSNGHRVTPEERFLFLESWAECVLTGRLLESAKTA